MPNIDVSDLLTDPDFIEQTAIVVIRPGVVATSGGIARETDSTYSDVWAAIQPASSRELQLLPEGSFQQGTISIYTQFRLQTGRGTTYGPDIITWHGADYTVMNVDDWTSYGLGYIHATAILRQVNP